LKISQVLIEILTSHDIIIASSMGMEAYKIACDAAIEEIDNVPKEY